MEHVKRLAELCDGEQVEYRFAAMVVYQGKGVDMLLFSDINALNGYLEKYCEYGDVIYYVDRPYGKVAKLYWNMEEGSTNCLV